MADPHAGFAAAIALGRSALDTLARAIYTSGQFDHHLNGATPGFLASRTVSFENIFLDAPGFELKQMNQGRLGLLLRGWGPVAVTSQDATQPVERQDCHVSMKIMLTPRVLLLRGRLAILFDYTSAKLEDLHILPFQGSSFTPTTQTYLDSAELRALLELGIMFSLAQRGQLLQPFDISFLGALASDPSTRAKL